MSITRRYRPASKVLTCYYEATTASSTLETIKIWNSKGKFSIFVSVDNFTTTSNSATRSTTASAPSTDNNDSTVTSSINTGIASIIVLLIPVVVLLSITPIVLMPLLAKI